MNERVLDPNDPDDLREILELIREQEMEKEPSLDSQEEEILLSRSQNLALNLQFWTMLAFNYSGLSEK